MNRLSFGVPPKAIVPKVFDCWEIDHINAPLVAVLLSGAY